MGLRARVKARLANERDFVLEDVDKVRKRLRRTTILTGARKSSLGLLAGAAATAYGLSLWAATAAWVFIGVSLIVYGLVLVDLDADNLPRRRRRRG